MKRGLISETLDLIRQFREILMFDTNASKKCLKPSDDGGYILITALLFMVILTIMGTASVGIRNTEQQITKNSEIFQHNFYTLEAVTLEGASAIENLSDTILLDSANFPSWLKVEDASTIDLTLNSHWPSGFIVPSETSLDTNPTNITPPGYASDGTTNGDRVWYSAVETINVNGDALCEGGSVSDPTKMAKCYDVYGMYDINSGAGKTYTGKGMMQVGYQKNVYLN